MAFTSLNRPQPPAEFEEKYPALRIVLMISKLVVASFGLATAVMAYLVWQEPHPNRVAFGLLTGLSGTLICLIAWAQIEMVEVVLDIEENTRRTAERNSHGAS